jgi:perosamine synthetase
VLAGVQRGDLVIIPNITFVAPCNSIRYVGADPILIDVAEDTWQIDLDIVSDFLEQETSMIKGQCIHRQSGRKISAILPVHVLGNMCDMDKLLQLSEQYSIAVVEDATEALGSYFKKKHAGSFGTFGCLSYNGNKIMTTGGGGMILCNDLELAKRAKHLTTQAKADANEYFHDEVGYNYRLVNILAAMGVAQLEQLPTFLKRKKEITETYDQFFARVHGCSRQKNIDNVSPNNWLYTVRLPNQVELRKYFSQNDVEVRPLWVPMNQLPAFKIDLFINRENVSDKLYKNCLSLPCSTGLKEEEQQKVIKLLQDFYHD